MILVTTQCFPPAIGGIETLMAGLVEAAHAVRAEAAGGDAPGPLRAPVRVLADGGAKARRFDKKTPIVAGAVDRFGGLKPVRRWSKAMRMAQIAAGGDVDAIVADTWKSVELLGAVHAPVGVWAHGNETPAAPSPKRLARIRSAYEKADVIWANSRFTEDRLKIYAAPEKVRLCLPPIDKPAAVDAEAAAWAAAQWPAIDGVQADDAGPKLLALCRLDPRKGVDHVIRALPGLAQRYPGVSLVVAGDGQDRPRLDALVREAGAGDRVRFSGVVGGARKSALFEAADLFVQPSRPIEGYVETYGIVFVEAAYWGTPSLAGLDGGSGDAVADGATGWRCDGEDWAVVAAALDAVLSDRDRLKSFGAAARARAEGETWDRRVDAMLADLRAT